MQNLSTVLLKTKKKTKNEKLYEEQNFLGLQEFLPDWSPCNNEQFSVSFTLFPHCLSRNELSWTANSLSDISDLSPFQRKKKKLDISETNKKTRKSISSK